MSTIELYNTVTEAIGARDHYNHNLHRRAVIANIPNDPVVDFGGGLKERVFTANVAPPVWILIVEDEV